MISFLENRLGVSGKPRMVISELDSLQSFFRANLEVQDMLRTVEVEETAT